MPATFGYPPPSVHEESTQVGNLHSLDRETCTSPVSIRRIDAGLFGQVQPKVISAPRRAMMEDDSLARCILGIRCGDSPAIRAAWARFYPELVQMARQRLRGLSGGMADEEDVALSAFDSFCLAVQHGRFPDLADPDDLWRLLLHITACKAIDLRRRELRQRRGAGRIVHEADLEQNDRDGDRRAIEQLVGNSPTPEFAATMVEQCEQLLGALEEPGLRTMAIAKLEGYQNREIADRMDCSLRTVERRLGLIRKKWEARSQ